MGIVICKLPKAGLGNQLFPLMRAYTFAHLNKLPVFVTNYHQVKLGPWLRREKNKRNYRGFFTFQKNRIAAQFDKWKIKRYTKNNLEIEPGIKQVEAGALCSYFFSAIPHYTNRFEGLNENRNLVIGLFWKIISPAVKERIEQLPVPCIGVHIRMGDFRKLKSGEEFGEVGTVRTPESYFIDIIKSIRKIHGTDLPVSVFTDGLKTELKQLFLLNNVAMIEGSNDLEDMILLGKSKIIVTSAGSTFSYWAAFISEAAIISHPAYANIRIRPHGNELYEGTFEENNEQLTGLIRNIKI
jgi:hypothetical protein